MATNNNINGGNGTVAPTSAPSSTRDLIDLAQQQGKYTEAEAAAFKTIWEDIKKQVNPGSVESSKEKETKVKQQLSRNFGPARCNEMMDILKRLVHDHAPKHSSGSHGHSVPSTITIGSNNNNINNNNGNAFQNIPPTVGGIRQPVPFVAPPPNTFAPYLNNNNNISNGALPGVSGFQTFQPPVYQQAQQQQQQQQQQIPRMGNVPTNIVAGQKPYQQLPPLQPQQQLQLQQQQQQQQAHHQQLQAQQQAQAIKAQQQLQAQEQQQQQLALQAQLIQELEPLTKNVIDLRDDLVDVVVTKNVLEEEEGNNIMDARFTIASIINNNNNNNNNNGSNGNSSDKMSDIAPSPISHNEKWQMSNVMNLENITDIANKLLNNNNNNNNNNALDNNNNHNNQTLQAKYGNNNNNSNSSNSMSLTMDAKQAISNAVNLLLLNLLEESVRVAKKRKVKSAQLSYAHLVASVTPSYNQPVNNNNGNNGNNGNASVKKMYLKPLPSINNNMAMKFTKDIKTEAGIAESLYKSEVNRNIQHINNNSILHIINNNNTGHEARVPKSGFPANIAMTTTTGLLVMGLKRKDDGRFVDDEHLPWWERERKALSQGLLSYEEMIFHEMKKHVAKEKGIAPYNNNNSSSNNKHHHQQQQMDESKFGANNSTTTTGTTTTPPSVVTEEKINHQLQVQLEFSQRNPFLEVSNNNNNNNNSDAVMITPRDVIHVLSQHIATTAPTTTTATTTKVGNSVRKAKYGVLSGHSSSSSSNNNNNNNNNNRLPQGGGGPQLQPYLQQQQQQQQRGWVTAPQPMLQQPTLQQQQFLQQQQQQQQQKAALLPFSNSANFNKVFNPNSNS